MLHLYFLLSSIWSIYLPFPECGLFSIFSLYLPVSPILPHSLFRSSLITLFTYLSHFTYLSLSLFTYLSLSPTLSLPLSISPSLSLSLSRPYYIISKMSKEVRSIKEHAGLFTPRERQAMQKYVDDLSGCIGSSERIVQTPGTIWLYCMVWFDTR